MRCRRIHRRSDPVAKPSQELHSPLDNLFAPNQICVIGVEETPGNQGLRMVEHLAMGNALIHVIRPAQKKEKEAPARILGQPVVTKLGDLPNVPDLAVLASPPTEISKWIRICGAAGIPAALVQFIRDNGFTAWQFLLAINVMLIILGMFLEVASILLIAMPIIIPVLKPLGIDPVHFAIVVTVNMELALITAPVGLNLYVLATVSKTPLKTVIKGVNPFLMLLLGLLLLITYIPAISLWLPNMVYG